MMKRLKRKLLLIALLPGFSPLAMAAGEYAGGQWAFATYSNSTGSVDADVGVAMARYGMHWKENMDFEVRGGIGISDDTTATSRLEVNTIIAGYLMGRWDVGPKAQVYGAIGIARVDLDLTITGLGSVSASDTDISYGVGFDYEVNNRWSANAEYMIYYDSGVEEVTALSFGATYRF